jgi:hypothetical protein
VKENANFEDRYFSFPPVKVQIKFIKHLLGVNTLQAKNACWFGVTPYLVASLLPLKKRSSNTENSFTGLFAQKINRCRKATRWFK